MYKHLRDIILEDTKKEQNIDTELDKDIHKTIQNFPCPATQIKKVLDETEKEIEIENKNDK